MSPDTSWTITPGPVVLIAATLVIYVMRWRRVRAKPSRLALWIGGVVLLVAAMMSPIDRMGEQILIMHMVQHLILLDLVPILMILALTRVILRPVTRRMLWLERRAGFLAHPVFAVLFYCGVMWGWHVPALYDAALEHPPVHALEHLSFSIAGALYWWHILAPIPPRHRLSGLGPAAYMASTKIIVGVLGVVLTFAPASFYDFYQRQPEFWGLGAQTDQAIGGLVMAIEQSIVMGIVFGWLFVKMLSDSEKEEERAERFGLPEAEG
jgi:cytochrome c oxidase assembly factor CtaG